MSDPKGFMKHGRQTPTREAVQDRLKHFKEFYAPMDEDALKTQASRCMDCGVPFCQGNTGCPVENLIPEFNDLLHQGLHRDALRSLHSTNNFPEFTGRLCPAPCESACTLGINDEPVAIRTLESSIIERGFQEGWISPRPPAKPSGKKVAIIGSGPAGLAAAQQLARAGHDVTVFEKADRIGGLLRYGIPDFKMEKWVLDRRLAQIAAEGVKFKTGIEIGSAAHPAEELVRTFDAVCLTIGAEEPRELKIPGRELQGIHPAMDYLIQSNRRVAGHPDAPFPISAQGKRVVIIGGGDTGSDCLGTAHREGALTVHQFELLPQPPNQRSTQTPWPTWPMQLRSSHAHEEGGKREWSISTTAFIASDRDPKKVQALEAIRVKLENGKFHPVPGTEFKLECDLVLLAMGFTGPSQTSSTQGILKAFSIAPDSRGNIATGSDYRTSNPKVFAAGDARRGASLIVWAIAEGRKMAAFVDRQIRF
ncbi:MAG: glutamate synthase subunit beta [Bdellovibrionales bacterium]|nr:glutamate synthase subunit beta [Bdellovibrionales bacterium]